ncbi:RHS repeat-associated core domain-containing protein [Arachidicoccus sp.]|uniref:RHS repeat protein n=1 Tax=Arachidicoccus sp. TaxID=1872624 RepID=UPI003D1DE81D
MIVHKCVEKKHISFVKEFSNSATGTVQTYASYTYDSLGQLIAEFVYDETGARIAKKSYNTAGQLVETTWYTGDAIYIQTTGAATPEEYAIDGGAGRIGTFYRQDNVYAYELRDQTGNVRAVVAKSGSSLEVRGYSDYYPYGMVLRSGGTDYRYGYQGAYAEKDGETDWNAFELRMYDSRIARWLTTDPAGQYYSPYLAMGNDPVNNIDANGGESGPGDDNKIYTNPKSLPDVIVTTKIKANYFESNLQTYYDYNHRNGLPDWQIEEYARSVFPKMSYLDEQHLRQAAGSYDYRNYINKYGHRNQLIGLGIVGAPIAIVGAVETGAGALAVDIYGDYKTVKTVKSGVEKVIDETLRYAPRVRERALEDPSSHNFPYSFDKSILETDAVPQKNGYNIFRMEGNMNGKDGVFEIGQNKDGIIDHRFFRPLK